MSESSERVADALRASLKETERLRQQNRRLRNVAAEPIAILGMSCRYPGGVSSPEELWSLLAQGVDAISSFPDDRGWDIDRLYSLDPDKPGTTYSCEGGFVAGMAEFDPAFFGISPREALIMDPQERLLLEAAWEALEAAGIDPSTVRGTQAGVFAGVMYHDYARDLRSGGTEVGDFLATGGTASVSSGRISYTLGVEGPAITVDTACSSSLVALHLAARALRGSECDLALAGGVTALSTPEIFTQFSRQRGLAADGRCKSFAEAADGTGFSEGVGMLLLERLSDAQANGHPVLATIRGSAVNQDGASNGLTAPNGPSQERVIRQALANARLTPKDIDAVEAHGTGTTLGDPIEAGALLATYGQDREAPLKLGSLKSNIGHTQAAAGVAGVIKAVLAMQNATLPKTLHVDQPSSKVDWEAGKVELLTEAEPWEANGRPRRAAVSSFGASGTNAHLILEEGPQLDAAAAAGKGQERAESPVNGPMPLVISAKTDAALRQVASRLAAHAEARPELGHRDLGRALATARTRFEHRAAVVAADRQGVLEALAVLSEGGDPGHTAHGRARGEGRPVFLFPGQGPQWLGMGVELAEASPAFDGALRECEDALAPHLGWSVREVLRAADDAPSIDRIEVVQPVLFAISVSLARLWETCGVRPAAVLGHSQGEIAAAHIAGGLSLADAAMLAAVRSRIISQLAGHGAMVSVALPPRELGSRLGRWEGEIEVAARNGPASTLLSATREAADGFLRQCDEDDVRAREIPATIPSHSARVEPLHEELLEALAAISPRPGDVPFHSTVTGEPLDTKELDASYWYRNLREPVLFEPVLRALLASGHRCFVEVGPHPVLAVGAAETIEDALGDPGQAAVVGTLRRNEGGPERFAQAMAEAHVAGAELDWDALFAGASHVPLPTYPFQRKRYWLSATDGPGDLSAAGLTVADHPLLSASIEQPEGDGIVLTGRLSLSSHPWLRDHAVAGTVLLPGTAFVELALRAGEEAGSKGLDELTLLTPLILEERGAVRVQVLVGERGDDGKRDISIHSRAESEEAKEWTAHATGTLSDHAGDVPEPPDAWPPAGAEPIEVAELYENLAELGVEYGSAFRGLTAAWRDGEEIYAELALPEELSQGAGDFLLHPALFDAAGHAGIALALGAGGPAGAEAAEVALPFAWRGVRVLSPGRSALRVRLDLGEQGGGLIAMDEAGTAVAVVESVAMRPVDPGLLRAASRSRSPMHRVGWVEPDPSSRDEHGAARIAILGEGPVERLDGDRYRDLPALAEALAQGATLPDVVVAGLPRAGDRRQDVVEEARALTSEALTLLQAWVGEEPFAGSRLCLLAQGTVPVGEGESPDLAAAPLAGLLRSASSEHPDRFSLIDCDDSSLTPEVLAAAVATGEPIVAVRGETVQVPRLERLRAPERDFAGRIDPRTTVLITGGTGGMGALVARHLVAEHGVRHILLVSRGGEEADGGAQLRVELEELGAEPRIAACDVSDRSQLEELLTSIPAEYPLGAVFHSAAVLDDGMLTSLDLERFDRVMRPKADAAWHLHELTAGMDLSAFVLFSSVMGLLGGAAQANYAAANTFLDALAAYRRAQGLPATSLAWGGWALQSRMIDAAEGGEELARIAQQVRERLGLAPMPPAQGLDLLDLALAADEPILAPVAFDRSVLRSQASAGTLPAILRTIAPAPEGGSAPVGSLADRLAAAPEAERKGIVLELVRAHVAAVLGYGSAADIDPDKAFRDLGFDSLAAVELRNRLVAVSGLRLAPTVVFDYPSTTALAGFLHSEARGEARGAEPVVRAAGAPDEPIAIVGMACRYPGGADSPERLWRLLAAGSDAIGRFPADRGWDLDDLYDPEPGVPGRSYVREGGFVAAATEFDPGFFGISPREALAMDPQERALLESSWEALEHGGVDPGSLRGSRTGVFAGVMYQDYGAIEYGLSPGMTSSGASGRVSYTLGLEGPAITVDTACSSSLVAMHLASQALRGGECDLALAGGATVLSTPGIFLFFSLQRALSVEGRCRSFAETADGTAIAEGTGVVLLERLSDAQANGHPILATIRGSAVNQDGASNGLTAPNGPSQERVIRQALANARLTPKDIDAVEAHGTGTTLGDPIEAGAILATYGQDRERPLKLGSLKSNIGHTQAAAGVGGVIKAVLAMQNATLPKTLHIDQPSSKVDWSAGKVELLTEQEPWQANGAPRRAAVSSFGASGTNAHLILEEGPPAPQRSGDRVLPGPVPMTLSAKTEPALAELAGRLASSLDADPSLDPLDVAYSLAAGRAVHERRAVVLGADRDELLSGLAALRDDDQAAGVVTGRARPGGKLAYLFTGQGSQRAGMGKELHASYPVFAAAFDEACAQLDSHLGTSLAELVFSDGEEAERMLTDTTYAQPALFAIEVALFRLLESFGLAPDFLAGHSIGELSAAHVAGILALPDAAALVAARGRLMGALPSGGAMLAVQATEAEALELLGEEPRLSIAAINSPGSVVVSGEEAAIAALQARCEGRGRKAKRLAVSHAFHSPLIEPMLEELEEVAAGLDYGEPSVPVISNPSGRPLTREQAADPSYWARQARAPVRFTDAVTTLLEQGTAAFLELGPDAVLCAMARECSQSEGGCGPGEEPVLESVLREGRREPSSLLRALAAAHVGGAKLDWSALVADAGPARVHLPTYPFQRSRYWLEPASDRAGDPAATGQAPVDHPLLGASIALAEGEGRLLTGRLSPRTQPWLADHVLAGVTILPATALVEAALRAAGEVGMTAIEELTLQAPLVLTDDVSAQLQVVVSDPDEDGRREISIHSRPEDRAGDEGGGERWTCHARGTLAPHAAAIPEPPAAWPPEGAEPLEVDDLYERLADIGVELGPAFRGVRTAWRRGDEVFVELALPGEQAEQGGRFGLHPALLDSVGHVGVGLALAGGAGKADDGLRLPFAWQGVTLFSAGATRMRACVSMGEEGGGFVAFDDAGQPLLAVDSVALRAVDPAALSAAGGRRSSLRRLHWLSREAGVQPSETRVAALATADLEGLEAERFPTLDALLEAIAGGASLPGVVVADVRPERGAGGEPLVDAQAACGEVLALLQAWIAEQKLAPARLCLLTGGAVAVAEGEDPDLAQAPIWGLARSAQSEHPGRFALIDTDGTDASGEGLPAALAASAEEPQIALRGGSPLVPRLAGFEPSADAASEPGLDPEATILITGGTSGLGALVARHLAAEHGARRLLLVSRGGERADGAARLREELVELGAEATIAACDVADRAELRALLDAIPAEHPLGAVVHSAGVLDDGVLESLDPERLDRVMRPKAEGAWNLHELTRETGLRQFVMFSSAAGLLGTPGQANYAAANTFLDALAAHRQASGLPAISLAWGGWMQGGGMTEGLDEADLGRVSRLGIAPIDPSSGLELFDVARATGETLLAPLGVDRVALRALESLGTLPAVLRGLAPSRSQGQRRVRSLAEQLAGVVEGDRYDTVLELVRTEVATVLGHISNDAIEAERAFSELGFDSLAAVELRNRLNAATGLRLPPTLVFDYPTAAELAEHLLALAEPQGGAGGGEGAAGEPEPSGPEPAEEDPQQLAAMSNEEIFELIDSEVGARGSD